MLTGGQVADCTAGADLIKQLPDCDILHADKGYDANAIRRQVEERGAMPNIPPKANRRWKNCFSPFLYRKRNAIERMFCRLKDFRRIATRYDRNANNFLAAVCIAATVSYTNGYPPRPTWAQSRMPIDLIWCGMAMSLFQASHTTSMISS